MTDITIDPYQDGQFNVRIADYRTWFESWRDRSADYRARARHVAAVPYGPTPEETFDIFPADRPGASVHFFIHGGYWQARDKSEFSFLAEPFNARGACVALCNYGLCPAVTLDAIVEQVRRSFAWLWKNVAAYGGDPARIQVSGHSAGGQLVAMLMATDWPAFDPALPARPIHSAVTISGCFDLDPIRVTRINKAVGMDAGTARRNSPMFMEPKAAAPLVLAVGGIETESFFAQARALEARWAPLGVAVEHVTVPGCHHLSAVGELANESSPLFEAAWRLLGRTG